MLVKLVTPPLVSVPLGESSGLDGLYTRHLRLCRARARQAIWRDTLPWVLLAGWSAGAGAMGCVAWHRWARFRRLLAHARPAPPEWQSLAARLGGELSLRRPPEILVVPGRLPPLVVAGLAPAAPADTDGLNRIGSIPRREPPCWFTNWFISSAAITCADGRADGWRGLLVVAHCAVRSAGSCGPAKKCAAMRPLWHICHWHGAITLGCCWMWSILPIRCRGKPPRRLLP